MKYQFKILWQNFVVYEREKFPTDIDQCQISIWLKSKRDRENSLFNLKNSLNDHCIIISLNHILF